MSRNKKCPESRAVRVRLGGGDKDSIGEGEGDRANPAQGLLFYLSRIRGAANTGSERGTRRTCAGTGHVEWFGCPVCQGLG